MAERAFVQHVRRQNSLLARYSETFGEMMLRKSTETAIRAARQETELNARSKSAFLSTMSHELRTPLNAIIGFSELICIPGAATAVESADYASHITKAGRRLLEVVNDVIDMSKLESGSMEISRSSWLVADIVEAAADQVRDAFLLKGQNLEMRCAPNLGEVEVDGRRLRQLLVNLLANASKFTGERGRTLIVAQASPDGGITIAVADTGIGMTHEQMMLAIKPFTQVDGQRARSQEGAGLGLPLAVGIARLHGGALHLDSQPGQGTTAVLSLPAAACRADHASFRHGAAA